MKKNLFLASALVMGMMSSCSSDVENVTVPGADQNLQPVELSIASPSVIVSPTPSGRGIGTVGDLAGEVGNVWNGEDLYVNMMCVSLNGAPVWDYSAWDRITNLGDNTSEKVVNFQNVLTQAPKTAAATAIGALTLPATTYGRYYPTTNSRHAFFAYHIDDAAATDNYVSSEEPVVTKDDVAKTLTTYFVLDGSQDLMVGKATPNQTDEKGLSFSAQSARAGIKPVLRMKHLLTRFTFEVQSDANLIVNKIIVKSKTKGKMIVAYADEMDVNDLLTFEDETASLELKERSAVGSDLVALQNFTTSNVYQRIGEALMVAPGEKTYEVQVIATQNVGQNQTAPIPYTSTITIPDGVAAAAGTSYNVKINLYGLQQIDVDAELTGWVKGDNIELTPGE